ncbi:MAG: hypothetical protein MUE71_08435 [Chitinophagaceae bacterium]|jgi:hypothetical protein|nr:hypothetical protein [Chitinophagaceae bacterium]MCU0404632.1 hypothetical protein [Chitinophagaceae bacterium]
MKKLLLLSISILAMFSLEAQKQKTSIAKSWRDPETMIKVGQFQKILVVAFVKNQENRKIVEDDIAKQIKSKAIPSYSFLGENEASISEEELAEKIKDHGFDGAVVMQLLNPDKEIPYNPGTGTYPASYQSFLPHFGTSSAKYRDPEYLAKHDLYVVETNFYSLKTNKLIWNAITTSVDPKSIDKMIESIGKVITTEMKKQGFLY